jgi:hypothetical protein
LETTRPANFHGPDCEEATRLLEEALGEIKQRKRKPEFLSRAKARTQRRVGG